MSSCRSIIFVTLTLAITACQPARHDGGGRLGDNPDLVDVRAGYRYPIDAPVTDSAGVRAMIDRARGRVVLLYFWTRLSEGARSELRQLAVLQNRLHGEGLSVIACSLDDAAEWQRQIRPLLASVRGNFPCVVVPEISREPLRNWLAPNWRYECPMRFVIARDGRVVAALPPDEPFARVLQTVENVVLGSSSGGARSEPAHAGELTIKLIDVRAGRTIVTFPPLKYDDPTAIDAQADGVAQRVTSRTDRVAVLPFVTRAEPTQLNDDGLRAAERFARCLRVAGLPDLVEPRESWQRLSDLRLSPMTIDFDPADLARRWPVDYVVLGWWRPPTPRDTAPRTPTVAPRTDESSKIDSGEPSPHE